MVLEILSEKKDQNLKFSVIKDFLKKKLKKQKDKIESNRKKVKENTEQIAKMKGDIRVMKSTAKSFDQKNCTQCKYELKIPAVYFMCGHAYHEYCLESEGIRKCTECLHSKYPLFIS